MSIYSKIARWLKRINELTRESLSIVGCDSPQVFQITLITHKHDNNVRVRMVAQFLQPPCDVDIRGMLCNVVDKQSTDCTSVIPKWNIIREEDLSYGMH